MTDTERLPGHRRRVRPPGRVRRLGRAVDRLVHDLALWGVVLAVVLVVLVLARTSLDLPRVALDAAVLISTTALTVWLTVRAGGSAFLGGSLAIVVSGSALVTRNDLLLTGATVATAVVATVLGLLVTAPAARFRRVLREYLLALLVAGVGAFTASAYDAPVDQSRAYYSVIAIALLGTFGLVYKLGAGLHGLGRRGVAMVVAGTVLLFVVLAYTRAVAVWGSPDLQDAVASATDAVRDAIGAVPRPGQFLLGFPALVWGISQRARRRQGWWFCAFGSVGLAGVTTALLDPTVPLGEAVLGVGYSAVLGAALGYLLLRADAFVTGNRGRGARRAEEASAHRPEPARLQPLM